ncbi:lasso peptide isopeptide bond-forming cyclase [Paenibacillus alkaliterrae]|uniref:lasso peptide isopeptide bond-forming cyclase n=1 Tax=Paenibacillus alkaliterrae TaxID=320909 RepID=UPI001F31257B|nr:lasso peptide isopeptide bond-forming cyclase [Paenibacillus alkaliterrae]MCF2937404.1 lasso peptide isopeptide bond-forming cyclase [Paenibacillus alkaliterrae]
MSAIAGVFQTDNAFHIFEQGSSLMDALTRYPCDTAQAWHVNNIFLGCHNQWITPESIDEQNPYYDSEKGLVITADAIIDNRAELFDLLKVHKDLRKQMTDSELIMLAYDKWGEESPGFLIGDFAFMIWDERECRLFGARDFSGSRTLYYHWNQNRFAFCTTIEPLFFLPGIKKQMNEQWLAEFLVIAGMVDVADTSLTAYHHVEQLPPSHSITITGEKLTLKRYCLLTIGESLRYKSDDQYVEAFQEVFQEAVSSRLRTFRNVGSQLSGGLDSGSIVSFAARELRKDNKQLHTFSYVPASDFIDYTPKYMIANERPFIESTVRYVGGIKDHYLDFQGRDSYSEIDGMLGITEMPYKFYVNSFWLRGMFEQAHSQDAGILLNGGRGNLSISWGGAIPYYARLLKRLKWIRMLTELRQYSLNIGSGRKQLMSYVGREAFPFINRLRPLGKPYHEPTIIHPKFARKTNVYAKLRMFGIDEIGRSTTQDPYELRKQHFEQLFQWNASNTLSAKLSLRYSLWKRDPTNDIRVIRYCLSLPEEQYVQNGLDRALIRRATENLLPDNVRLNQRIRGVQGVDWVHRMLPKWQLFTDEIEKMCKDNSFLEIVDGNVLREANSKLKDGVRPEHAYEVHLKVLMNSLIVYRFIKNNA